jgi:PAS domain S-box-containing protein
VRSKHLTVITAGLLFVSPAVPAISSWVTGSPAFAGVPTGTAVVAVLLASAGAAWGLGRRAAGRTSDDDSRRLAVMEDVGEEVVWECDSIGRFTYASAQCLQLLGYSSAEARSLSLFTVIHPDEHRDVARLLETGQGWRRRRFRCVAKDGAQVWLRSSAVSRLHEDGRLAGLTGASHRLVDLPADCPTTAVSAAVLHVLESDAITTAFQPIVSLSTGRVLGVEALSRFSSTGELRTPEDWFTEAAKVGLGVDLELHAVLHALEAATGLPDDWYVSVNLAPATLVWPGLFALLTGTPIAPSRIVVEMTEHASVADYDRLARALRPLREAGIRLAVDDAGAGYACFRHILCLSPDVIKLDRTLITGIDTDPGRRALAAAVVTFARDMQASVIAEGIEGCADLEAVRSLAVDAGQGYLFGRPSAVPEDWRSWHGQPARRPPADVVSGQRT